MTDDNSIRTTAQITPQDGAAEISSELIKQRADSHPAKVRLSLLNKTSDSTRFDFGFTPPFSRYVLDAQNHDARLIFVPPTYSGCPEATCIPDTQVEGCWTSKAVPEILETGTYKILSPSSTVERDYALLNHPDNDHCFPEGRHTGTDTIRIGRPESPSTYHIKITIELEK